MTQSIDVPVGQWSGKVVYEGKTDEYTVTFDENGDVSLVTADSTGSGSWSATGQDTFSFMVKEVFTKDDSGAAPAKVLPGAAYVQINIDARHTGSAFTGEGIAEVRGADGSVIHSTKAETSAERTSES
jgi:hypothetical protein